MTAVNVTGVGASGALDGFAQLTGLQEMCSPITASAVGDLNGGVPSWFVVNTGSKPCSTNIILRLLVWHIVPMQCALP